MDLGVIAAGQPDAPAVIAAESGARLTFAELDRQSNQAAHFLRAQGLGPGDHIAVLFENTPGLFPVVWAAQRTGLYFTPINWHLTADEAAYIVADCGARVLVASGALRELATRIAGDAGGPGSKLMTGGEPAPGFADFTQAVAPFPASPVADQSEGLCMFYSSGTTGRPKGVKRTGIGAPFGTGSALEVLMQHVFGFGPGDVYLCPGPLYHAAPLQWSMGAHRLSGTVVVMERFDARATLELIERYRVTHVQMVPTMFVRLLKLPPEEWARFDLSSLRSVVHAAAPCPVEVKAAIIDRLGPIVHEYYAGSEANCFFYIDTPAWLTHQGSVGRPVAGEVHICDDDGNVLPAGEVGTVWFEGMASFEYHNDPEKTRAAFNSRGWSTLGDLGCLDAEGYLYLSDRRTDLILSGGVNIYPKEVEDVLIVHPAVSDVCVLGLPDPEMGQQVKAVVELAPGITPDAALADELIAYCRGRLARYKCPRSIDFSPQLPRLPSGKMLRRVIREQYDRLPAPG